MKYNLAKIDLLKILHELKCPISAYDTIVGWVTRWNSNKLIFDSSFSYKFNNCDQLLRELGTKYDMTNMKPSQVDLQCKTVTWTVKSPLKHHVLISNNNCYQYCVMIIS